jgi:hypothetical protein
MAFSCGNAETLTPWEIRASVTLKSTLSKSCETARAAYPARRRRRIVGPGSHVDTKQSSRLQDGYLYNGKGDPSPRSTLWSCLFGRECGVASASSSCRIHWSILRSKLEQGSCCAAVGWQKLPKVAKNNRIRFKICTSFSKNSR